MNEPTADEHAGPERFIDVGARYNAALAANWDVEHPDGESEAVKWVSIIDGKRTVCYFLLFFKEGEIHRVGLARKRKGKPPNPFDRGGATGLADWFAAGTPSPDDRRLDALVGELVASLRDRDAGRVDADKHPGTPMTVGVHLVVDDSGDHRWQLPGFKIRGSVLARVLWGVRQAGHKHVPLGLVRSAARR
ncbi:hypothetical protein [Corynebacterium glyciniphilum]|uniref:hypothetical protein n=1 Tax=Corynebacterium glyciniphilum TaxID=1404244 RepID=UPI0011AB364F|nr:hypothetical protein [Corynebacterium glyciniphilum]